MSRISVAERHRAAVVTFKPSDREARRAGFRKGNVGIGKRHRRVFVQIPVERRTTS
jgi:hypothetical protein